MATGLQIVLSAVNKASGPIGEVTASVEKLEDSSGGLLKRGLGPLATALGTGLKVAAGAAVAAIGGLAAGIGASVSSAGDMEQQLADISASMGTSSEDTGKLKKLIGDLGFDPKLKVSSQEAADAIQNLGTAGLSVDQILGGAAKSTVLLANATGADFGQAATIATDVMAQFGIKAEDMQKAVDGITSTTVASKFDINDYQLALAQAGGVAATVGVGFDDFNATIAAISPYFASGSDAGTSFKTMLQTLIPKSDEAATLMQDLGIITADGANQFFDASGNMKDMGEIAGILNKALGGLSEEQKNNALATIFGTDAMRAAAALAQFNSEKFGELKATMAKTDAEESAATRMNTLRGALEILGGVFDTLKLQIGDKFLPVVRQLVERFTEFLQTNAPAIVEWAGALADGLAGLVDQYLPVLVNQWIPALIKQAAAWWEIGKQVVAVTWSIGQTLFGALQEMIGWVRGTETQFTTLRTVWATAQATAVALFNGLMAYVQTNLSAWLAKLAEWGAALWGWISPMIAPALAKLGEWAGALWNWVTSNLPTWLTKLSQWGSALWGWISPMIAPALAKLGEWAGALWNWVTSNLPTWLTKLSQWGSALWGWISPMIAPALAKLGEWAGALWNWVAANLPTWLTKLSQWGSALWGWIAPMIAPAVAKLGEWAGALLGWVTTNLPGWVAKVGEWGNALWGWIAPMIAPVLNKIGEWAAALWNWIKNNLPTWIAKLGEWGAAAWQWIVDAKPTVLAKLGEWGASLWNWVKDNLPSWLTKLGEWGAAAWQWIVDAKPTVLAKLGEWGTSLWNWVKDNLPKWIEKFLEWETAAWEWIGDAIPKAIDKLTEWVDEMLRWSSEGEGNSKIGEMFGKLATTMLTALGEIGLSLAKLAGTVALNLIISLAQGLLDWAGIDVNLWKIKDHMSEVFNNVATGIKTHFSSVAGGIIGSIASGMQSAKNTASDMLGTVMGGVVDKFNTVKDSVKTHFSTVAGDVIKSISGGFEAVRNDPVGKINDVLNGIGAALDTQTQGTGMKAKLATMGRDLVYSLRDGINNFASDPTTAINTAFGKITSAVDTVTSTGGTIYSQFKTKAGGLMGALWEGLSSRGEGGIAAIGSAWDMVINWVNEKFDAGGGIFVHLGTKAKEVGVAMMWGLYNGIKSMVTTVTNYVSELASDLIGKMKDVLGIASPSKVFAEIGGNVMAGLTQGIQDLAGLPQQALAGATAGLVGTGQGVMGGSTTINNTRSTNVTNNFAVAGATNGSRDSVETVRILNTLFGSK